MKDSIKENIDIAAEVTGLSKDAIKLLNFWATQPAVSYNVGLIDELIMKTPEYVYPKYKALTEARKASGNSGADFTSRGMGDFRPSSNSTKEEEELAKEISDILCHFLAHNMEVSLSECKNYASARRKFPCTRERLKRIQDELLKNR